MQNVRIWRLGDVEVGKELEVIISLNFPFVRAKIEEDNQLVTKMSSKPKEGNIDPYWIIPKFTKGRIDNTRPTIIVTGYRLCTYDLGLDSWEEIPGGAITHLKTSNPIAIVSILDLWKSGRITSDNGYIDYRRKVIHELGHWYGLQHHDSRQHQVRQCPMVIPEAMYGKAKAEGMRLCGFCQERLNPVYVPRE
jgi:hypothetical protein